MKILVPVDGSKYSSEGIRVASYFAQTRGAAVVLLTVIPSVADIDLELSASERDRLLESMKHRGEDLLHRSADQLRSYGADDVRTVLATAPSTPHEIISFAEREKSDLIVIGCKGRGASARFSLGSVAASVVRHSHCCVYVVKEHCWTAV